MPSSFSLTCSLSHYSPSRIPTHILTLSARFVWNAVHTDTQCPGIFCVCANERESEKLNTCHDRRLAIARTRAFQHHHHHQRVQPQKKRQRRERMRMMVPLGVSLSGNCWFQTDRPQQQHHQQPAHSLQGKEAH